MTERGILSKVYMLELQERLLELGYENVELAYLSHDEKNATLCLYYGERKSPTTIGLFGAANLGVTLYVSETASTISKNWGERVDAAQLAREIIMRDPQPRQAMRERFQQFTGQRDA